MKNARIKVLIIEDDLELAVLTRECIRVCRPQADVEICTNGRDGMRRILDRSYDCVFVDLSACTHGSCPECIIKHAKMNFAYTVVCTGVPVVASSMPSWGQDDLLLKPFEIKDLEALFSRHDAQIARALDRVAPPGL